MRAVAPCPNCVGKTLYAKTVEGGGRSGPQFLPGLGEFLAYARFQVVVCGDCGLTRLFADEAAMAKLPSSRDWTRLIPIGG